MVCRVNGEPVMRAYTPTSSDDELGYFDLVIKVNTVHLSCQSTSSIGKHGCYYTLNVTESTLPFNYAIKPNFSSINEDIIPLRYQAGST